MLKPLLNATQTLEIIHTEPFFGPDGKWYQPALPRPDEIIDTDVAVVFNAIFEKSNTDFITIRERGWIILFWMSVRRQTEFEEKKIDPDDEAYLHWIEQDLPNFKNYWDSRTNIPKLQELIK